MESFARWELGSGEALAFEDFLGEASLPAIDRYNRSMYADEAGGAGRPTRSVPGVALT